MSLIINIVGEWLVTSQVSCSIYVMSVSSLLLQSINLQVRLTEDYTVGVNVSVNVLAVYV